MGKPGKLIQLDSFRKDPHFVFDLSYIGVKEVHMVPVETFKRFVRGELGMFTMEDPEGLFRFIVKQWLFEQGISCEDAP